MMKFLRNVIYGAVFASTLIIPGVSGTLFAVVLNFYDDVLFAVNHFRADVRRNVAFLSAFVLGIIAGTVLFSSLIMYLLTHFSLPTMFLFVGLLLGMLPFIFSKAAGILRPKVSASAIILILVPIALLVMLSFLSSSENPGAAAHDVNWGLMLFILLAGVLNGATLVIPGMSGSLLLVVMGIYPVVMTAFSSFTAFFSTPSLALLGEIAKVLAPYGLGALVGFFSMARLMEMLMRKYSAQVHAVITGFIIGSIFTILRLNETWQSGAGFLMAALAAITLCAGAVGSFLLGRMEKA